MSVNIGFTGMFGYDNAVRVDYVFNKLVNQHTIFDIVYRDTPGHSSFLVSSAKSWGLGDYIHRCKTNQEVLDFGLDLLVAFDQDKGSASMMRMAHAAHVPIWRVTND